MACSCPLLWQHNLTEAIARLVQPCGGGSGGPGFISAAVTSCTRLEVNDQIFELRKIVFTRLPRRDRDIAGQGKSDGELSAEDVCSKPNFSEDIARLLKMSISVKYQVPKLDGFGSEQEELHGQHRSVQRVSVGHRRSSGSSEGGSGAWPSDRCAAGHASEATKFRERANGMPRGESWTVGFEDPRKLDRKEFLTHARNAIGTDKQLPGMVASLIAFSAAHDEALDVVSQFTLTPAEHDESLHAALAVCATLRRDAWTSFVTGLLVKAFTLSKDKVKLRSSVTTSMALLSNQKVAKSSLHRLLQAEVEIAKHGAGNVLSYWGRRVRRWLLPHGVNRSVPDVKCVLLISRHHAYFSVVLNKNVGPDWRHM